MVTGVFKQTVSGAEKLIVGVESGGIMMPQESGVNEAQVGLV